MPLLDVPLRSRRLFWRFGATLVLAVLAAGILYALARPATFDWLASAAAPPVPAASRPATAAPEPGPVSGPRPTSSPTASPGPSRTTTTKALVPDPWQYATTAGGVLGSTGPLRTFRVAVEEGLPVTVDQFTQTVDATLGDARSWVGAGTVRLRHVAGKAAANFTIYLARAQTAYQLCLVGDVDINIDGVPYTSCRVGSKVVINADRYLRGVPDYGAPLADYRQYVINHEVGHWLGHDHVNCPGAGQPAPVMQQQTLGLQGCVANSWPQADDAL